MAAEAGPDAPDDDLEGDDELVLSPGEVKYRTLEQMSKDIKGLDEVRLVTGMGRNGWGCKVQGMQARPCLCR